MTNVDLMKSLTQSGNRKVILLVMDGLGDYLGKLAALRNLKPHLPLMDRLRRRFSRTNKHSRYWNNPQAVFLASRAVWIHPLKHLMVEAFWRLMASD